MKESSQGCWFRLWGRRAFRSVMDETGEFENRIKVVNRRDQVEGALAELMLEVAPEFESRGRGRVETVSRPSCR